MKQLLAVEGPDGSGKTTFLSTLVSSDLQWEHFALWHSGGPVRGSGDFLQRMKYIYQHDAIIVDRLPLISEVVYCRALHKPFPVPEDTFLKHLLNVDPIVVYCRLDSAEEMLERMLPGKLHKSAEYYATLRENHPRIVEAYDRLIAEIEDANILVIRHNWQQPWNSPDSTFRAVAACNKAMRRRTG